MIQRDRAAFTAALPDVLEDPAACEGSEPKPGH